ESPALSSTAVPMTPKHAPASTTDVKPQPFKPAGEPGTGTAKPDSAVSSGRRQTGRAGKFQQEEARTLDQQRAAEAAHRNKQAAPEEQQARQSHMEKQQHEAAAAELARRKAEGARREGTEQ